MTVHAQAAEIDSLDRSFFDRAEFYVGETSRVVAIACVCGMLFVAALTMIDVLLRWFANEPIPAINEIVQMTFSVAISACIPAGMIQRVNLKIDLVARYFSPPLHAWLEVLGSACLWLFYAVLAWRIFVYADTLASEGRTTVILGLAQAPFMYCVSLLLAFGTLVQTLIIINKSRRAAVHGAKATTLAVVTAVLIGLASWWWVDHHTMLAAWAQTHIGLAVTLVFVIMWLMTLILIPIAAIMGIVGVIASALFIGLMPSLGAASTEVTGFLGNSQLATLPLFLMMGSFAAVADISEDVYRLAHVMLGRLRGGLALATIAGCAGFGALTGHSISTAVTIGKVALPEMRARGYSRGLSDRRLRRGRHARRAACRRLRPADPLRAVDRSLGRAAFHCRGRARHSRAFALPHHHRDLCPPLRRHRRRCNQDARSRPALGRCLAMRSGAAAVRQRARRHLYRHLHRDRSGRGRRVRRVPLRALRAASCSGGTFWHVMAETTRDHGDDLRPDLRRADLLVLRRRQRADRDRDRLCGAVSTGRRSASWR